MLKENGNQSVIFSLFLSSNNNDNVLMSILVQKMHLTFNDMGKIYLTIFFFIFLLSRASPAGTGAEAARSQTT